eukprot:TRINITY_DN12894_c0_g1_i1.p1 TRINITY_DN12894_c0_g1~~TRINITY_DN12894_c0_g1_i1.p1  ORF type:complete len:698 (+),score=114.22 TRINITY_DN12894_c0_g1_i1:184-2277(+)
MSIILKTSAFIQNSDVRVQTPRIVHQKSLLSSSAKRPLTGVTHKGFTEVQHSVPSDRNLPQVKEKRVMQKNVIHLSRAMSATSKRFVDKLKEDFCILNGVDTVGVNEALKIDLKEEEQKMIPASEIRQLKEGLTTMQNLRLGEKSHFKIRLIDRLPPLIIDCQSSGIFEVFLSTNYTQPDGLYFDMRFSSRFFTIPHFEGSPPWLYLTIFARSQLEMAISFKFNARRHKLQDHPKTLREIARQSRGEWSKEESEVFGASVDSYAYTLSNIDLRIRETSRKRRQELLQRTGGRDLVKINCEKAKDFHLERKKALEEKQKVRTIKNQEVLARKKQIYDERRERNILYVRRHSIRRKSREFQEYVEKLSELKYRYETTWPTLLMMTVMMEKVYKAYRIAQREKAIQNRLNLLARRLQRFFLKQRPPRAFTMKDRLAISISRSLIIAGSSRQETAKKAGGVITKFLSSMRFFFRFRNHCVSVYNKACFIQRRWRQVIHVFEERMKELKVLWDQKITQMIEDYKQGGEGVFVTNRGSKKKIGYLLVAAEDNVKSIFLKKYLQVKAVNYLKSLKEYHEKIKVVSEKREKARAIALLQENASHKQTTLAVPNVPSKKIAKSSRNVPQPVSRNDSRKTQKSTAYIKTEMQSQEEILHPKPEEIFELVPPPKMDYIPTPKELVAMIKQAISQSRRGSIYEDFSKFK